MKLEELLPQLHNKITYIIFLDRTTYCPTLRVTKTTNTIMLKMPPVFVEPGLLSLEGERTMIMGTIIRNVACDGQEIVEYKHDYIKFNKNRKFEDWYITQTEQGLVNAIKTLFKKYKLPLSSYKYIITVIKNSE